MRLLLSGVARVTRRYARIMPCYQERAPMAASAAVVAARCRLAAAAFDDTPLASKMPPPDAAATIMD